MINSNSIDTVHGELHISLFEVLDARVELFLAQLFCEPNSQSTKSRFICLKQFISNQEEPSMTKYNRKRN